MISISDRKCKIHSSFPLLLIFFSLWGCGQWREGLPEHILARVNQEQITIDEFNREFKGLISEPGKAEKAEKDANLKDLKQACLDQMIDRKILLQEARRSGMKVSQEELNQAFLEIKMDYPGEGFGEKLGLKGITMEEWKVRLEEKMLAEKMIHSILHYRGSIDEMEARQYYETHISSFQLKPRVRVRQIIVADGEEAIQILKQLKKGESFEKVAVHKSLGPERAKGGDLGYFSQGEKPAEFDHVFSMEVGMISDVIKSPYGYHIFKLEEKTGARQIPFEEAKSGVLLELMQKKGEEEYQKWLKALKGKANIKINKKWLRA